LNIQLRFQHEINPKLTSCS